MGTGDRSIQCFHCRKSGHIARYCYQLQRQPERPQVGGRGGGNGRGAGPRHDAGVARQQTTRPQATGRVFTVRGAESSQSPDLIQGMCLVSCKLLSVLFDSGATHSFISDDCVKHLQLTVSSLPHSLVVSTPTNSSLITSSVCLKCPIIVENRKFFVDLVCSLYNS